MPRRTNEPRGLLPFQVARSQRFRRRRFPDRADNPVQTMGARWSGTTKRVVVALFGLAALYIVYRAGDIVRPFVWAGILAYVLLPVVALLERRFSMPRTIAALIVFVALVATIIGGGRVLVPLAVDQVRDLQRSLPSLVANAQNTLAETADQLGLGDLDALLVNFAGITDLSQMIARGAVPFVVGFGHFLLELLVFLIATFFLLRDAPRLFQWLRRLLPPSQRNEIIPLFAQVNALLGRYVRGQIFLIGVMATVTVIGLSVLQVPFALLLVLIYVGAKLRDEDPFPQLEEELEVQHPAPAHATARAVGRRAHS